MKKLIFLLLTAVFLVKPIPVPVELNEESFKDSKCNLDEGKIKQILHFDMWILKTFELELRKVSEESKKCEDLFLVDSVDSSEDIISALKNVLKFIDIKKNSENAKKLNIIAKNISSSCFENLNKSLEELIVDSLLENFKKEDFIVDEENLKLESEKIIHLMELEFSNFYIKHKAFDENFKIKHNDFKEKLKSSDDFLVSLGAFFALNLEVRSLDVGYIKTRLESFIMSLILASAAGFNKKKQEYFFTEKFLDFFEACKSSLENTLFQGSYIYRLVKYFKIEIEYNPVVFKYLQTDEGIEDKAVFILHRQLSEQFNNLFKGFFANKFFLNKRSILATFIERGSRALFLKFIFDGVGFLMNNSVVPDYVQG